MRTILLFLLFSSSVIIAQEENTSDSSLISSRLGISIGAGLGKMSIADEYAGVDFDALIPVYKLGGVYNFYNLNKLNFLGTLTYISQGGGGSINGGNKFTMRFNYLTLGALAEYQIIPKTQGREFYAGGGLNLGLFLGGKFRDKASGNTRDLDQVRSSMVSLKLKGGTYINLFEKRSKLGLDFNIGLSNTNTDEKDGVTRLNSILVELVYPIF